MHASAASGEFLLKPKAGGTMSGSDFDAAVEQYHQAVNAIVKGDSSPQKLIWSRQADVTLANPFGPPIRGWSEVEMVIDRAASRLKDGESSRFERISGHLGTDMAYIVEIERTRVKVGQSDELAPVSLRVTTIFRLEDGQWKVAHRHADPITSPRPVESIIEK
jgi:ketosteroid isomerase-like protein